MDHTDFFKNPYTHKYYAEKIGRKRGEVERRSAYKCRNNNG